jgi:hypothetical protein
MAEVYYEVRPGRVKKSDLKVMQEGVEDTLNMMTKYALAQNVISKMRWKRPRLILPRPEPVQPDEYIEIDFPFGVWVLAMLLFGVAESFTTALITDITGANITANVIVKTIIMGILFLFAYYSNWKYSWTIPLALCILGTYLTLNNLVIYFSAA